MEHGFSVGGVVWVNKLHGECDHGDAQQANPDVQVNLPKNVIVRRVKFHIRSINKSNNSEGRNCTNNTKKSSVSFLFFLVCVCVRACVRAYVRAFVRACVRACVRVCVLK